MYRKKGILKNFVNFTGINLRWSHFLIKLHFWGSATLLKNTPTQMIPREICEIFKKNYFEKHLWTTASKLYLKRDSNTDVFLWILWIIKEHLFCRASFSRYYQNFTFLTILWFTKSVMWWWVLEHETRCIFEYIFWTTVH